MLQGSYPLGFKLSLHHKDLGIALEAPAASTSTCPSQSWWNNWNPI